MKDVPDPRYKRQARCGFLLLLWASSFLAVAEEAPRTAHLRIVAAPLTVPTSKDVVFELSRAGSEDGNVLRIPSAETVALEPGRWRLRCSSEKVWCPETEIELEAERALVNHDVLVLPLIELEGMARTAGREDLPENLGFQARVYKRSGASDPIGTFSTTTEIGPNGRFSVALPSAVLDLGFRPRRTHRDSPSGCRDRSLARGGR